MKNQLCFIAIRKHRLWSQRGQDNLAQDYNYNHRRTHTHTFNVPVTCKCNVTCHHKFVARPHSCTDRNREQTEAARLKEEKKQKRKEAREAAAAEKER